MTTQGNDELKPQYENFCKPLSGLRVPAGYLQTPETGQDMKEEDMLLSAIK